MSEKIKVLLLGGSNSVMKNGYIDFFLENSEFKENIILDNFAIGANSCVHGLEVLHSINKNLLKTYDIILIEYTINDHKLASQATWNVWCNTYEAIIRYICKYAKATAKVMNIILGRRDEKTFPKQKKIRNEIFKITEYYNYNKSIVCNDVDRKIKKRLSEF